VSALKVCPQCDAEYPANARFCEIDGTALRGTSPSADLVGSIIADRYNVIRKLGQGGMGQVYLVEHVKMGRKSALKVMHPGMVKDVDAITRFNREAANASRISHPNVAAVYDFGETADGVIYLAMEFVDGPPLTKIIEEAGGLPLKRAAEITRQTADALAVAHDLGIVHRDLKPDNIMIGKTRSGDDLVKVVDFGIAKASGNAAQKVTKTGNVVGTPDYMSPEQLAGDTLDYRSDIYSLGLVTFNMLTSTLPFPSDSPQESMIMRLTDKPKTLAEMRPDVNWPPDVQAVMDKALERRAALRYQAASDFARDLSRAIEQMVVPPTRVARPTTLTPASGPTAGVPAAARAGQPGNGSPASLPPLWRQKPVQVVGSIAVLLVVSAVVYKPILGRSKTPPLADATHSTPSSAAPASLPGNDTAQNPDTEHRSDATKRSAGRSVTTRVPQSATVDIDKELSNAEAESRPDDTVSARAALRRIQRIEGRLVLSGDIARAGLVKYEAWATLRDETKACSALTDVKDRAKGTPYKSKVDALLLGC
jgi:serine/threonine-protein kinase